MYNFIWGFFIGFILMLLLSWIDSPSEKIFIDYFPSINYTPEKESCFGIREDMTIRVLVKKYSYKFLDLWNDDRIIRVDSPYVFVRRYSEDLIPIKILSRNGEDLEIYCPKYYFGSTDYEIRKGKLLPF